MAREGKLLKKGMVRQALATSLRSESVDVSRLASVGWRERLP